MDVHIHGCVGVWICSGHIQTRVATRGAAYIGISYIYIYRYIRGGRLADEPGAILRTPALPQEVSPIYNEARWQRSPGQSSEPLRCYIGRRVAGGRAKKPLRCYKHRLYIRRPGILGICTFGGSLDIRTFGADILEIRTRRCYTKRSRIYRGRHPGKEYIWSRGPGYMYRWNRYPGYTCQAVLQEVASDIQRQASWM